MPNELDPKEFAKYINSLTAQRERLTKESLMLTAQISALDEKIESLKLVQNVFNRVPPTKPQPQATLVFVSPSSGPNATIGDAMADILTEAKKPLPKDEIVERIRLRGVGISLKNPKIVLAIAIKRDKKQRFVALEDGRVALKGRK